MVPIPVWERPEVKTYDPEAKTDGPLPTELPETAQSSTNVSGRWWKTEHKATTRAQSGQKAPQQLDKAWKQREERRKRDEAIKKLERELKQEKEDEADRKKRINLERREKEAEKKRLAEMAARMSAKKLQRMKKRLGRSKKVNG
ncbi:rRNA-processing protein [Rhodotorula toruloides]|uniref:rRNA-processing protein n=1 Tax=Rhodotorula toruloides TaxID=5286 RepID=A0A0K3CKN3_RHOTO|nr:rRNA-processing protein [Rhodotorula toruloides]PRQ72862.1 Cgr1 family-domain containing protein [Rhodotorula toruloides]